MNISKKYITFLIVIYGFALQFAFMKQIDFFKYWDEIYALLCLPLSIFNFKDKFVARKKNKYINLLLIFLILFIADGILSNILFSYQDNLLAILNDLFLNLKFFMGILTTYYLFKNFSLNKYRSRIKMHIKFLIILFFILVVQNKFTHFFAVADNRFGIFAEKIFFNHPTELASTTFFLLLLLVLTYTNIKKELLYIIMSIIVVLMTLRFKAIATIMLFIYICFIALNTKKMKLYYLIPLIPFVIVVGGKEFIFYFFSDNTMLTARGALTYTSLKIANDVFPIGSGFGTFASWMSGVYYSPLYSLYGIDGVWGLTKEWPAFVSDVFWPMIIAQNGFAGLVLYILIIFCLFKIIIQCSKSDKKLFLAGVGSLSYLLISSIAESAFVNPLALPLSFVIGLCICKRRQIERGVIL